MQRPKVVMATQNECHMHVTWLGFWFLAAPAPAGYGNSVIGLIAELISLGGYFSCR
jgi:hypothetical protein